MKAIALAGSELRAGHGDAKIKKPASFFRCFNATPKIIRLVMEIYVVSAVALECQEPAGRARDRYLPY
ncbi:hypothetical protein [Blastomonas sp.]|uniref:hypothetical protein n=1 Tax=Blastomonas sp. TaxID=1909299 RepID=UPI0035933DF3